MYNNQSIQSPEFAVNCAGSKDVWANVKYNPTAPQGWDNVTFKLYRKVHGEGTPVLFRQETHKSDPPFSWQWEATTPVELALNEDDTFIINISGLQNSYSVVLGEVEFHVDDV
jgi:hypothetical protein